MKYIITSGNGRYLVDGQGFVGTKATATRFDLAGATAAIACVRRAGVSAWSETAPVTSFAPNYVRPQNRTTTYSGGRYRNVVGTDNNNPSAKRFATLGEAQNHANRAMLSQGHVGFWITETNDPVTHYVSVKENPLGLTCPIANA